ncbi:MAG: hypothetical protein M3Y37_08640 [Chloroflexota bacterium]|nr:hypothetical protein [Chloroflexota bacterium]
MDANRFNRLTRLFTRDPSRRSIIGFSASGIVASLLGLADAEAKKGKKCKRPPCGPCTVSTAAASLVTQSKLNKKPLRLLQHANFANGVRQSEVTFNGKSVLKVTHEIAEPGVVTAVTYGGAFSGINQARFATDGVEITGEIDGRAIVPLSVYAGPGEVAFADGGPPLDVQGDARLVQAIPCTQDLSRGQGIGPFDANLFRVAPVALKTTLVMDNATTPGTCGRGKRQHDKMGECHDHRR